MNDLPLNRTDDTPPWPLDDSPRELGFQPRPMVRWLSPRELASTALRVVLSGIFGAYADKRELQATMAGEIFDYTDRDEVGIDYVADLGDGFNSTYSIACLLAEEQLRVDGPDGTEQVLPRGDVLVLGGDQVYPTATTSDYRDRMLGPYRAALPSSDAPHPSMFVVPGNHDWYDGLTAFMRVFCQGAWVGGWKTRQTRSYFALRLPGDWWLWAVDIQFDTYIDSPQMQYFTELVAPEVSPGSSIILCAATPSWMRAMADPSAYDTLDYFERKVVRERCQSSVRLALSGDTHAYARYDDPVTGAQRIISGGGGAFLSATHHLPDELIVPPPDSTSPSKSDPPMRFERKESYPDPESSKRMRRGIWRLPFLAPSFAAVVATIYTLYAWSIQASARTEEVDEVLADLGVVETFTGLARSPLAVVLTMVLAVGMAGLTKLTNKVERWVIAGLHLAAHLVVAGFMAFGVSSLLSGWEDPAFTATFLALSFVIGGVVGTLVFALYLAVANLRGMNANELFSAQRIEDHKHVVRLRVRSDGLLEVRPIVLDRVGRNWKVRPRPDNDTVGPWLAPAKPPSKPRLFDHIDPIRPHPVGSDQHTDNADSS